MKMNKKFIYILILCTLLIPQRTIANPPNNIIKVDKEKYSKLLKQAHSFERGGLFDEAEMIYKNILLGEPGNKTAFNKIKIILKNKNNLELLKELAEAYQKNQKNNIMATIDLI